MDKIKIDKPLCVYCYKPASFTQFDDLNRNETAQEISERFLNLLSRHLNINSGKLQCTHCCDDCLGILKAFCELYHQIKCLELKLNWQLDKLLNVMKWADRVPSRLKCFRTTNNFENNTKFRKKLKRKCKRHLSQCFPRVSISVRKSSVIPKIENLVLLQKCNEEITFNEVQVLPISVEICGNFYVNESNKTEHFLLGWVTTFSALIFLCHLEVFKSRQIRDEPVIVSLEVDENASDILPVSRALQAISPVPSDDDDYHSPELEDNIEIEEDSFTSSMEIHLIKEEKRDNIYLPSTTNSYFKTPLGPVVNAPELMSISMLSERRIEVENINLSCQPTENQQSVLPLFPETSISVLPVPETLPNASSNKNSILKPILTASDQTRNMPSTSSPLQDNTEASIIPAGRRSLRTKYQCSKCKATFSDISRFQGHHQKCHSKNDIESDTHSDNDDIHDTVEFMTGSNKPFGRESSSEHSSDEEFKHDIETNNRSSRSQRRRQNSKIKKKKTERKKTIHINKRLTGKKHLCIKCTPNMPFHTNRGLKNHEYYKHSNGRVEIDNSKLRFKVIQFMQLEGLSITTKHTCPTPSCGESFLLSQELENHKKLHGKFTCLVCDFTTNHAIELVDHELQHSDENQKSINTDFKIGERFACLRCSYKNQFKREFVNHYMTEHLALPAIQAKCPICQQAFLNVPRVPLVHYVNFHDLNRLDDPNSKVICTEPDCSAYFLTEEKLHLHRNRQHVSGCTSQESNNLVLRRIAKRKTQKERVWRFKKPHRCTHCQKRYMHPADLRLHIRQSHGTEISHTKLGSCIISKDGVTVNDIVWEQNAKYFCQVENCQEKFREEADFERHSKLHGEFFCDFCEVKTTFALELAIHEIVHVTTVNDQEDYERQGILRLRTYKCSRCPYQTGFKMRYIDHFVSRHLNLKMDKKHCPVCKFEFSVDTFNKSISLQCCKKAVHRHFMDWHDFTGVDGGEEKCAERCDKCSAYFRTKLQLLYHNEEAHNTENRQFGNDWGNVCCDCGKYYVDSTGLRLHRKKVHKVDLNFKCEVKGCSKKVETLRDLIRHDTTVHSHTNNRHTCSECGKCFSMHSALVCHKRSHEEKGVRKKVKRAHVCEKCGKSFKYKQKLQQHYKFHEGPESWEFECEICKKKLSSKQKLNEHMRTHTKEKPFVCQVCGVAYAHRHNLRNHTNSKHKEVEDVARKCDTTNFASTRKGKRMK